MKPAKSKISPKAPKTAHTANTKYGMGDSYGSGVRQKLGTVREGIGMVKLTNKKLGTPPKSLA